MTNQPAAKSVAADENVFLEKYFSFKFKLDVAQGKINKMRYEGRTESF